MTGRETVRRFRHQAKQVNQVPYLEVKHRALLSQCATLRKGELKSSVVSVVAKAPLLVERSLVGVPRVRKLKEANRASPVLRDRASPGVERPLIQRMHHLLAAVNPQVGHRPVYLPRVRQVQLPLGLVG